MRPMDPFDAPLRIGLLVLVAALLAYVAGFAFARDPVQYRRLLQAWRDGHGRRVVEDLPLWLSSIGLALACALAAAEQAKVKGLDIAVLDALFLKPLDEDAILTAMRTTGRLLTVEEHCVTGGLGTAVADVLARHGVGGPLAVHGLPDEELLVASTPELHEHYGLTPEGVLRKLEELLVR